MEGAVGDYGIAMASIPQNVSESVRRRNPHLYGGAVGAVEARAAKPTTVQALDGSKRQRKKSKGRVEVVVTLICCRRRIGDDDSIAASCKPLRDAIANSLGLDDGDARIRFEYSQCRTDGQQGVMVKIQSINNP